MKPIQGIFFRDFQNAYIPHILKEVYIDRIYHPYLSGKKDLTILDVGANIGLTTFYFKDFAKKVYSIEPSQEHMEVLKTMLTYNKIDNVVPIQCALANTNGKTTFYHNNNTTMYSLKEEVSDLPEESETVETITLDAVFKKHKIDHVDFMKLDVEGFEHEIINSQGFDTVCNKIDVIVGEHHSWSGRNPYQLAASLRDKGFEFGWFTNTEAQIFIAKRI